MGAADHAGNRRGVQTAVNEGLHDHLAGGLLIAILNFIRAQNARAGNVAVKIIGVGRAVKGNRAPRLRPCGGKGRMGVRDAPHVGKRLVKFDMRGRIGRRTQLPFHHVSVQIDDDKVVRRHVVVAHARRLNDDQPACSVDLGDVSPGEEHQFVFDQIEIGF